MDSLEGRNGVEIPRRCWREELALAQSVLEQPHVMVKGVKYYSDRFYLNAVNGDDETGLSNSCDNAAATARNEDAAAARNPECQCGAKQAPPLFSREDLIHSLDLKAVIMGTFNINTDWLMGTFPQLVGPKSTVPTLILHGDKSWNARQKKAQQSTEQELPDSLETILEPTVSESLPMNPKLVPSSDQHNSSMTKPIDETSITQPSAERPNRVHVDFRFPTNPTSSNTSKKPQHEEDSEANDGMASFQTQEEGLQNSALPVVSNTKAGNAPYVPDSSLSNINHPPNTLFPANETEDFGRQCHIVQVRSTWTPSQKNSRVTQEPERSGTKNGPSQQFKRGVHHPKFMLLFQTNGDLVVVVSTANLTPTRTVEGSWVQRFRRCRNRRRPLHPKTSKNGRQKSASENCTAPTSTNDFGSVLQDFLLKLSASSDCLQPSMHDFLQSHLQLSLNDFAYAYNFEQAQVHLVPVVPGEYQYQPTYSPKKKKRKQPSSFAYGPQRVQQILLRYQPNAIDATIGNKKRKTSFWESGGDRLIVQPTSFGGNWTPGEMAHVGRCYLNYQPDQDSDYWNEDALLKRMDIVWPSRSFIRNINKDSDGNSSNEVDEKEGDTESSFVFLSSNSFNSCDYKYLSRMALYEASVPHQQLRRLVPHFKSIGRLLHKAPSFSSSSQQATSNASSMADEHLSWFLLTSACLSHGAQGRTIHNSCPISNDTKSTTHFANFELGVMFLSRQPTKSNKESKLYCFRPHQCSCSSSPMPSFASSPHKLIHLPIPYSLRPKSYLSSSYYDQNEDYEEDDCDYDMDETPFFHEIDPASRCIGNMLLTPYGKRALKRPKTKRSKSSGS